MPASADIYGQIQPFKAPNPLADMAQVMQIKGAMNQDAASQYTLRKSQRQDEETNALSALLKTPGFDLSSADGQRQAYGVAPTVAPTYIKSQLDAKKTQSDMGLADAHAANFKTNTHAKQVELSGQYFGALRANPTPENFASTMDALQQNGIMPPEMVAQIKAKAAADPTSIATMAEQGFRAALSAKDQLAKFEKVDTGGGVQVGGVDLVTAKFTPTATLGKTATPGEVLSAQTSRANNADTIKKDLTVAGLNGDGTSNGNDDSMIDAIGQYKIAPPNGMAMRNPRMQQILAKVADKYPEFDATQYGARQTAAKSFSTGKDAQAVQAANTALNHLDTVEQLAMAQKNGDMVLFNKIANQVAANTGQPAPTNLRAAISMVAPELTKAVVGTGGGVGERADFAHNLNPDGSPAQILQGIGTIKELMGGRLSEVERTYGRSTGRKDFRDSYLSPAAQKILAARASADGGANEAIPPDIAAIFAKHGGKKGL